MKLIGDNYCRIKSAAVLFAASLVCVALPVFAFTGFGASVLFRLGVFISSETVDTGDTAYLEYYDAKAVIADTDGYRIFLGSENPLGYSAALDFLKFVKQNDDINTLRLDSGDEAVLNAGLESGDASTLSEPLSGFVLAVYNYNRTLPPQKRVKFAVGGEVGYDEYMITLRKYAEAMSVDGILDVSCIYPGTDSCDPLFDVPTDTIRFGSLGRLGGYKAWLEVVSGNLGMPEFGGINQPEFYFLIPDA